MATLRSVEWGSGAGYCLSCGANPGTHAQGCPIASALWPNRERDALDDAIEAAVFLAASQRHSIFIPLETIVRELEDVESLVTRIQCLMPRA